MQFLLHTPLDLLGGDPMHAHDIQASPLAQDVAPDYALLQLDLVPTSR